MLNFFTEITIQGKVLWRRRKSSLSSIALYFFDRKVNWLHQGYACGNVKQVNIEIGQLEAKFDGNP